MDIHAEIEAHKKKTCHPERCWWCLGGEEMFQAWLKGNLVVEKSDPK
jgi:hypothetical protein